VIELFKIIKGIYDPACVPYFEYTELTDNLIRTRGNKFKLVQLHCHYDLRKYNFTNRIIPIWKSLSNHVVSAETVDTFLPLVDISLGWISLSIYISLYKCCIYKTDTRLILADCDLQQQQQ